MVIQSSPRKFKHDKRKGHLQDRETVVILLQINLRLYTSLSTEEKPLNANFLLPGIFTRFNYNVSHS